MTQTYGVVRVVPPKGGGGARNIARRSHTRPLPQTPLGAPTQNMAMLRECRWRTRASSVFCRGGRYIEAPRKRDPYDHSHCRSHNSVTKKENPLLFLIRHAKVNAYQGKEVDMKCAQCGKTTPLYSWISENLRFCCFDCFETYQGKEEVMSMTYRGPTVTVKMYVTPPNGQREMFDMPASTFEHEAETEIDKMIPDVRCSYCKDVIKPGALYLKAQVTQDVFCCLRCYNTFFPREGGVPELKRLDSAPKAE